MEDLVGPLGDVSQVRRCEHIWQGLKWVVGWFGVEDVEAGAGDPALTRLDQDQSADVSATFW